MSTQPYPSLAEKEPAASSESHPAGQLGGISFPGLHHPLGEPIKLFPNLYTASSSWLKGKENLTAAAWSPLTAGKWEPGAAVGQGRWGKRKWPGAEGQAGPAVPLKPELSPIEKPTHGFQNLEVHSVLRDPSPSVKPQSHHQENGSNDLSGGRAARS